MKIQEAVKTETKKIAIGVVAFTALMLLVFLLVGKLNNAAFFGALLGACAAVGNFFLMALSVQQAAEKMNGVQAVPQAEDAKPDSEAEKLLEERKRLAKRSMKRSYYGRLLLIVAVAAAAFNFSFLNPVAALIPFLFPRMVIFLFQILQSKKGEKAKDE